MTQTTPAAPEQTAEQKAPGIFLKMKTAIMQNIDSASAKPDVWQPYNVGNSLSYDGIARVRLATAGFEDPRWLTKAQIDKADSQGVKLKPEAKEKGVELYFYKEKSPAPTIYTVYNAEQIDGLPPYKAMTPEKANEALRATAEKNGVVSGKGVKADELASSIIQNKMGELKGTAEEKVSARLAAEFLKAEHGIAVDVINLRDAFRELPEKSSTKAFAKCANEAGGYSRASVKGIELTNQVVKQPVKIEEPAQAKTKSRAREQTM